MSNPNSSQMHIDRALTNMSVAYMQDQTNFVATRMFPLVPVEKQSERYFVYSREDWFRDEAEERAPGTESAGGGYDIDNTPSYFARKYGYHKDVTEEDRTNADSPLTPDSDATDFVSDKLLLRREVLWATKYFGTGIWTTEYAGVAANPNATQKLHWSDANSDPIKDITNAGVVMAQMTGKRPNKLCIGAFVFDALKSHAKILDRIKYTQKGVVTLDLLATLFEVEEVMVAWAVKNVSKKGAAENNQFVMGKHALLVHTPKKPGLKIPSAGYTFGWTGLLGAGAYGNRIGRIQMPWLGQGTERIEGEMAFDQKVVAADLGVFYNGIVA